MLLSGDGAEYRQVADAIRAGIDAGGAPSLRVLNVDGYSVERLVAELQPAPAMVVTVGIKATRQALALETPYPVLATLVPRLSYEAVLQELRAQNPQRSFSKHSALYLEQPIVRQVQLARLLKQDLTRLGVLLGPHADLHLTETMPADIRLQTVVVDHKDQVADALDAALGGFDLLLTVYDPAIIDRRVANQVLYAAYRRRVAVIGYSEAMVAAGALAALHSDGTQIGRHAAELARAALTRDPVSLVSPAYPRYYRLRCNEAVARYLDLERICLSEVRQAIGAEE